MASQTNPSPHGNLAYLGSEVTAFMQAGVYQTAARVACRKENCGQEVELLSKGDETEQHIKCPTHGELAVFENFADYAETLKSAINESNDAMGLTRIDPDAEGTFERYS
jgi:hypothetical protein